MKRKLSAMSHRYERALKTHLKQGPLGTLKPALRLGRQAAALGIETLQLACIHEQAVKALITFKGNDRLLARAEIFFNEAISPIVETHRAGRQSKIELDRLNKALKQRTVELATTNHLLKDGVARRKTVEEALRKQAARYTRLLKQSLQLQENLRQLAHQAIEAQEEERKSLSHELQDQIAQNLLGINVRLLSLRQGIPANRKHLRNEITSTQRLVEESNRSVRRVAQKIRKS
jgi:signal transduction histidine kinase